MAAIRTTQLKLLLLNSASLANAAWRNLCPRFLPLAFLSLLLTSAIAYYHLKTLPMLQKSIQYLHLKPLVHQLLERDRNWVLYLWHRLRILLLLQNRTQLEPYQRRPQRMLLLITLLNLLLECRFQPAYKPLPQQATLKPRQISLCREPLATWIWTL